MLLSTSWSHSSGLIHPTPGKVKAVGVLLAVEVCRSLVAAVLSLFYSKWLEWRDFDACPFYFREDFVWVIRLDLSPFLPKKAKR
jgi:hypothetical protein